MSEVSERIERFKYMTEYDPDNELGHFSLGRAYMEAGEPASAIASLRRALEINPNLSKAYQLLAQCLLQTGDKGQAVAMLTEGVKIADARGDVLPRTEMIDLLKAQGAAIPQLKAGTAEVQVGEGQVLCRRCGRVGQRLAKPPFRNDFGKQIYDNTCSACWREAIAMGTKIINELRLEMTDPRAQKVWDSNIREFLNLPAS